ncbi:MAG: DUF1475 family protein [Pseudomonadota bacterium]
MIVIRILLAVGGAALIAAIVWATGADDRGLGPVLAEMLAEPWSIVTLIDLYLGFAIAATVIFLFERNLLVALIWALPTFALGNFLVAAWLVWRLPELARRLRG